MGSGSIRFEIGEFEYVSVSGRALNYPPESLFSNAPLDRGGSPRAQPTDPRSSTCFPSGFCQQAPDLRSCSKYDARKTLDAFSVSLRGQIDLDALNNPLVRIVRPGYATGAHLTLAGSRYTHEG
jgi:hypothetical protein